MNANIIISIHAPPRGATRSARSCILHQYFNSRPSARGDTPRRLNVSSLLLFQFTPLREGRHQQARSHRRAVPISIHAPPRGATSRALLVARKLHLFQFTPLREGRRLTKSWRKSLILFQFTPLREGRLGDGIVTKNPCDFNSRPSARGDRRRPNGGGNMAVFQFTPLREGRLKGE